MGSYLPSHCDWSALRIVNTLTVAEVAQTFGHAVAEVAQTFGQAGGRNSWRVPLHKNWSCQKSTRLPLH